MIDYTTIKPALAAWARDNTGLTYAIWGRQNAPQPYEDDDLIGTNAYVILWVSLDEQITEDYLGFPDDDGDAKIVGNREFTLYVEVKGKNAVNEMNKLRDSFQKPSVQDTLATSKIVYVDNFPVQDITGLDDTRYIERASMDVLLRTESEIVDEVGYIERVEITEKINNPADVQVYEETFEVDIT